MAKGEEPFAERLRALKKTSAMALAVLFGHAGYAVTGALFGFLLAPIAASLVAVRRTRSIVSFRGLVETMPADYPRRTLLTSNGLIFLHGLFAMSMIHVDVLLLNPVAGNEAAGYYKAALTVVKFLWLAPFALQTLFVYSTSTHWQDGNMEVLQSITERITRYTLLFSMLITLGLAALARPFVRLYFGAEYLAAVIPLLILLPGTLASSVGRPVFGIELANERPIWTVVVTGSSAILNLVLNLFLIPRYGMVGAAVATSVGYGSMLVFHIASARHMGIDPLGDIRIARVFLTGVLTAGPIFLTATVLDHDLLALAITPVVGLAVFAASVVATGAVERAETRELASVIQRAIE
jgi:O-antigen/teichoic acid export membrane protein